ncbi:hypothetical protein PVBG_06081 [Plasmodium vivax Brazil I]|uniref:VIR protein n=1 Tax=Plasmodium vivax (strain Brazil I) TaxID=1033975 RepID=A0A0J9T0M5_PLAV1|nr:hypothetical protein PVBG_06081 [Plasmodium vivax Brazil I]
MLKDYYDKDFESEDGMKYLEEYKNSPGDIQNTISKYYDIFKKLTNNLSGSGLMSYDKSITCMYNNYWLNKEVRKKNYNVYNNRYHNNNNNTFEVLKKYAHEYSKKKYANYKNSCQDDIFYMDSYKYEKMSKLYELYDMYNHLISPYSKMKITKCDTLGHLTRIYDQIIKDHEDEVSPENIDEDLYEKRIKMKDLIKKFMLSPGESCRYYTNLDHHTSKYERQQLEKLQALQKQQELEKLQALQKQQELENQQKLQSPEQAKGRTSLSSKTSELDSTENDVYPEIKVNQDRQTDHILTNYPVVTGHSRSSQARGPLDNSLVDEQEDNLYTTRSPFNSQLNAENPIGQEGIIGSMRSTLSSIVQNVDPVPVVGVSGGMGALFLLFRVLKILNQ